MSVDARWSKSALGPKITIEEVLDDLRLLWNEGACSLIHEITDYSGKCGRCGWSVEDHEYLHHAPECRSCGREVE